LRAGIRNGDYVIVNVAINDVPTREARNRETWLAGKIAVPENFGPTARSK
jgi:hypothetical protein